MGSLLQSRDHLFSFSHGSISEEEKKWIFSLHSHGFTRKKPKDVPSASGVSRVASVHPPAVTSLRSPPSPPFLRQPNDDGAIPLHHQSNFSIGLIRGLNFPYVIGRRKGFSSILKKKARARAINQRKTCQDREKRKKKKGFVPPPRCWVGGRSREARLFVLGVSGALA